VTSPAMPSRDPVLIRAHHPRAELVEDLKRQTKLSLKLDGRYAGCLAGHDQNHSGGVASPP
jgi:hypothetical protein